MVLQLGTQSTGVGIRYDLGAADSLYVLAGANVVSTDNNAIRGTGGETLVTVAGHVFGEIYDGISLAGGRVMVLAGASVSGRDDAIEYSGSGLVQNYGMISGSYGINIYATLAGSTSKVINAGTIASTNSSILFGGGGAFELVNTGTILSANSYAISTGGTSSSIINRGSIFGDVLMSNGTDRYDGRGGTLEGEVYAGAGNDIFLAGAGIETFDGGIGSDTLDFRTTSGIRVALDGGFGNTGTAAGDTYIGIEVINGSLIDADALRGDGLANNLYGLGGNDTLAGMAGNDGLVGGFGTDVLIGGLGNDAFVFAAPAQAGDVITDFSNALGNNDFFRIVAAGFGAGLTAGPLAATKFYSSTTNLAHDADDRFIFRTTDKTLWFDANGNAAGGLTMIADLQATAVVTVADIILV